MHLRKKIKQLSRVHRPRRNQAAETYAFDEAMAEKLRKSNPQAFSNVVRRMLEAAGRGMWNASPETLDRLRSLYADLDAQIEGVM